MEKVYLPIGFAALLLALPLSAQAECSSTACTAPVKRLVMWSSGTVSIQLDITAEDKANIEGSGTCTFSQGVYINLQQNHALFNEIFAALLTAEATGDDVAVRVASAGGTCEVSYAVAK